jgi:hypothetical protein
LRLPEITDVNHLVHGRLRVDLGVLNNRLARPLGWFRFGSSQRAFGHPGAGGSFAFADPERESPSPT